MNFSVAFSALGSIAYRATSALLLLLAFRAASSALSVDELAVFVLVSYAPVVLGLFDMGASLALVSPATRSWAVGRFEQFRQLRKRALQRILVGAAIGCITIPAVLFWQPELVSATAHLHSTSVYNVALIVIMVLTLAQALTAALAQATFKYTQFCLLGTAGNFLAMVLLGADVPRAANAGWLGYALATLLPPLLAPLLMLLNPRSGLYPESVDSSSGESVDRIPSEFARKHKDQSVLAAYGHAAGIYVVLQLAGVMLAALDVFALKSMGRAQEAAWMGTLLRGIQIFATPFLLISNQLWPLYAKLSVQDGANRSRSILLMSMATAATIAVGAGILIVTHGLQVLTTLFPKVSGLSEGFWSVTLAASASAYLASTLVVAAFAAFLNGASLIRPQLFASIAFIGLAVPFKLWFASNGMLSSMLMTTAILLPAANLVLLAKPFRSQFWTALQLNKSA